nr:ATP-binding protein [Sphingomonas melonis]
MPTNPGFHLDFPISSYPKSLHPAIRKIATRFYVTRAFKPIEIGNSNYWAILARPTDEFSVYINTDREVVILFSAYDTFEVRTLEAFDEFYDLLESQRIDRSVRFLVSADEKIEPVIKHYLYQHPEYPIIVPITFRQLTGPESNPLLDAVRRNYLLRDLFGYQNPLREETFFFGRQSVVNTVLDMAKSGQNSSLFGLRKSGKTSAIYAIQRRAKGLSANVAVIDCQNTAVHGRRFNALLSYIVLEIRKSVGIKRVATDISPDIATASEQFFAAMNNVLSQVKGTVLIIFDEIENISPGTAASPHWRSGEDTVYFWQIIRSYLQAESKGRLSICLVGTSPHILETAKINGIDNPIYLYAPKTYIPSLTFDETRDMVTRLGYFMGLEFDPIIIAHLQKEFGGHPFFTRQVCSTIHKQAPSQRPHKVSLAALNRANVEFSGQLESYLRDIVGHLQSAYPEEFDILEAVVNGDKSEVTEYGASAPDLIDHLLGYGLIDRNGQDFDIKFDAVKAALRTRPKIRLSDFSQL